MHILHPKGRIALALDILYRDICATSYSQNFEKKKKRMVFLYIPRTMTPMVLAMLYLRNQPKIAYHPWCSYVISIFVLIGSLNLDKSHLPLWHVVSELFWEGAWALSAQNQQCGASWKGRWDRWRLLEAAEPARVLGHVHMAGKCGRECAIMAGFTGVPPLIQIMAWWWSPP